MARSPGKAVAKAAQEHQTAQLARDLQVRSRPCASSGHPSVQANADWRPLMPACIRQQCGPLHHSQS